MVKIEFTTGSKAFHDPKYDSFTQEIARILRNIAANLDCAPCCEDSAIMDINGSRVGTMTITDD